MEHARPSLMNLTDKVHRDVATRLDGHSLLALLSTCRDLHGSSALRACLFEAVLQQLGALEAALQVILQATTEAEALLDGAKQVKHALRALELPLSLKSSIAPMAVHQMGAAIAQQAAPTKRSALEALQQARAALIAAQQAAGQPGQQAQAAGQELGGIVVRARQAALLALQPHPVVVQPLVQQRPEGLPAVQQQLQQAVEQVLPALEQLLQQAPAAQLGLIAVLQTAQQAVLTIHQSAPGQAIQQAMQAAQQAAQAGVTSWASQHQALLTIQQTMQQLRQLLDIVITNLMALQCATRQVMPAEEMRAMPALPDVMKQHLAMVRLLDAALWELIKLKQQVQRVMQRAAGRQLLAGRPQVDQAGQQLKAGAQAQAHYLRQETRLLLQQCVSAGLNQLQQADGFWGARQVLREAVQDGQAMLQGLETRRD